jgi:hypothetical protein
LQLQERKKNKYPLAIAIYKRKVKRISIWRKLKAHIGTHVQFVRNNILEGTINVSPRSWKNNI